MIFGSITGGLSGNGLGGTIAKAAAPFVAEQIGEYFKTHTVKDDQGFYKETPEHLLAHGILGAAVAAANGDNAFAGGFSAAGAEALAPILVKWLYPNTKPENLTAEQQSTITSILALGGMAVGGIVGGDNNVIAGADGARNAVDNNIWLVLHRKNELDLYIAVTDKKEIRRLRRKNYEDAFNGENRLVICRDDSKADCSILYPNDTLVDIRLSKNGKYYTDKDGNIYDLVGNVIGQVIKGDGQTGGSVKPIPQPAPTPPLEQIERDNTEFQRKADFALGMFSDFLKGNLQGFTGAVTMGACQACDPSPNDTFPQRVGQITGTVAEGIAGVELTNFGGGGTILAVITGQLEATPVTIVVTAAGVYMVTGATKNLIKIATTPISEGPNYDQATNNNEPNTTKVNNVTPDPKNNKSQSQPQKTANELITGQRRQSQSFRSELADIQKISFKRLLITVVIQTAIRPKEC